MLKYITLLQINWEIVPNTIDKNRERINNEKLFSFFENELYKEFIFYFDKKETNLRMKVKFQYLNSMMYRENYG